MLIANYTVRICKAVWQFDHPTFSKHFLWLTLLQTLPRPAAAWLAAQAALKLHQGQVRPDRQLWCQLPDISVQTKRYRKHQNTLLLSLRYC